MEKVVVNSSKAQMREFKGVTFELLAVGQHSMVTKMLYKTTDYVPLHSHPNEQSGYVVSGQYSLTIDGQEYLLATGDSYAIPANVPHTLTVKEAGEVVDVFTPPREDYF
jgi:quercetin dioxygenase-like cupin family protein